jgi:hypothetical protein
MKVPGTINAFIGKRASQRACTGKGRGRGHGHAHCPASGAASPLAGAAGGAVSPAALFGRVRCERLTRSSRR